MAKDVVRDVLLQECSQKNPSSLASEHYKGEADRLFRWLSAGLRICPALPSARVFLHPNFVKVHWFILWRDTTPSLCPTSLLSLKNRIEGLDLGMLAPYPMGTVIRVLYFPFFPWGLALWQTSISSFKVQLALWLWEMQSSWEAQSLLEVGNKGHPVCRYLELE